MIQQLGPATLQLRTAGATCVSQTSVAESRSVQQTVELLAGNWEMMLAAAKQGTFFVDCETHHTAASILGTQGQAGKPWTCCTTQGTL